MNTRHLTGLLFVLTAMVLQGCGGLGNGYQAVQTSDKIGVIFDETASAARFFAHPHYVNEGSVQEQATGAMDHENTARADLSGAFYDSLATEVAAHLNEGFETDKFEVAKEVPTIERQGLEGTVEVYDWGTTDYDYVAKVSVSGIYRSAGEDAAFPYHKMFVKSKLKFNQIDEQGNANFAITRTGIDLADLESDIPVSNDETGIREMREDEKILGALVDYYSPKELSDQIRSSVEKNVAAFCEEEMQEYEENQAE